MKYRIASVEAQAEHIKVFRMEPVGPGDGPAGAMQTMPKFMPGQWAFIHLLDSNGNSVDKRPYSIASAPSSPFLEFCIEMRGGAFTARLDAAGVGTVLGIEGPQGRMAYAGQQKAVFIAGGTGISPVMSMLRHIADTKMKGEFILFYSVRSPDRLLYGKELERLRKKNPCIKTVITLTRETPQGWTGECGRIGREMICKHLGMPADFDWWMCGPVDMIKAVKECLAGLGVDPKRVSMEGWG